MSRQGPGIAPQLAAASAALFALLCAAGPLIARLDDGQRGQAYLLWHLALSALMLLSWRLGQSNTQTAWLLVAGVLGRLALLCVPAFTTHDVVRYLWDGRVAWAGLDPYTITPATAGLRFDAAWARPTENLSYPTLYPPLAIALFALCASTGPLLAFWSWKILVTASSVALLLLGARLLRRHGVSRHLAVLALSPLLVLEAGVGAHLDVLAALALIAALACVTRRRDAWAGCALGLAVLLKLSPGLACLPLVVLLPRSRALRLSLSTALSIAVGYGLAALAGWQALGSLLQFFAKWRFGSPLYAPLDRWLHDVSLAPLLALLGVCGLAVIARWTGRHGDMPAGLRRTLSWPFVLSPVVFPWYLVPLVPLLALSPSATGLIWVSTLPLTYEVIDRFDLDGSWRPATWPLVIIALGWLVGWYVDRRGQAETHPT